MSDEQSHIPGTVVMNIADLQRLASLAATEAAVKVNAEARLTRKDVEEIFSEGLNHFCERCGLPTDRDGFEKFRLDLSSMRSSREMREEIVKHGWRAVVTALAAGFVSAVWISIITAIKAKGGS